jgi:hypothetical protein
MKKAKFILSESIFVLKTTRLFILLLIVFYSYFLYFTTSRLKMLIQDLSLPPEITSIVITGSVKATLTSIIPSIALFSALSTTILISTEKTDKVFEQIFTIPESSLKLILYRFIATIPITTLFLSISCSLTYFAILFTVGYINLPDVVVTFSLALIFALPLAYILSLVSMLLSSKYALMISNSIIVTLIIFPLQLLVPRAHADPSGMIELITLLIVIISILIAIAGLIITLVLKGDLAERIITAS